MITVLTNTSQTAHSNPSVGGASTAPTVEDESTVSTGMTGGQSDTGMLDLSDVDTTGLNGNDVLVFDSATGKFKPIDIDEINDNDGGTF